MTYTFELKTADGDDAGTLRTSEGNWQPGDFLVAPGNRHYKGDGGGAVGDGRGVRRRCARRLARGRADLEWLPVLIVPLGSAHRLVDGVPVS